MNTKKLLMTVMLLSSLLGGAGFASVHAAKAYALWCEGNKTVYYVYGETAYAAGGTYDGQTITQVVEGGRLFYWINEEEREYFLAEEPRLNAERVVIDASFKDFKPTDCSIWFEGMEKLTTIVGIKNFNTSEAKSLNYMFNYCLSLTDIDLSGWDTRNVTDMSGLFYQCAALKTVNLSGFNTEKVEFLGDMFALCPQLVSVDLSSFNTSSVIRMGYMFKGCTSLKSLDLSHFNTEKVTTMVGLFQNCSSLESLDISNFDTRSVTDMSSMFTNCSSLKTLDVSHFDTRSATDMGNMFKGCSALKELNLQKFVAAKEYLNLYNTFNGCTSLRTIYCPNDLNKHSTGDWHIINTFLDCTSLVGAIAYDASKVGGEYANPTTGYFTKIGEVIHTVMIFSSTTATATCGQTFTPPTLNIVPAGLPVTYESSEPTVAEVDSSTGAITLVGKGTTVITASYAGDDNHDPASASYTLTVSKGTPTLTFSYTNAIVTYGDSFTPPTLTKPGNVTVEYRSDNPKVATVDATTGEVTLLHSGEVNITASFAGDDNYNAAETSYKLTVNAKKFDLSIGGVVMNSDYLVDNTELTAALDGILTAGTVTLTSEPNYYDLTLTLNDAKLQSGTKTTLANYGSLTLVLKGSSELTSSGTSTATLVNGENKVLTITGSGQLKVTGYSIGTENRGALTLDGATLETVGRAIGFYSVANSHPSILRGTLKATGSERGSIECLNGLVLANSVKITQPLGAYFDRESHFVVDETGYAVKTQVTITDGAAASGLAFSAETATVKYGTTPTLPTLANPNNLAVTYKSSDTSVATVDADGKVTLVKPGETVISATFEGNESFMAGTVGYVLTVAKGDPSLSYSEATATVVFGAELSAPTLTVSPESLKNNITITSSNTAVAKITGLGDVTVVGAGETTIKAAFAGDDYYNAAEASYKLTVTAAAATLAFAQTDCSTTVGASFNSPELSTTPASLKVKYSSSNTDLATVSEETGVVVAKAEGVVTITATSADVSYTGSASYKLTITRNASGLQFASATATATYGSAFTAPELKNEHGLTVKYESSNTAVATVDETSGKVTLLKGGETTITARFAGNDEYEPASASYVLTVKKAKATLTFSQTECKAAVRRDFKAPKLTTNPDGLTVKYTSSDPSVANVNEITGFVVALAKGEATITATVVNDQYEGSASYKLTVIDPIPGDANTDFKLSADDIMAIVEDMLGYRPEGFDTYMSDMNGDNNFNIADIIKIVNKITGN